MTGNRAKTALKTSPDLEFRQTLGTYPTGVTIITARDAAGEAVGMTANSFASVSLDPPLILWSVRKSALGFETYEQTAFFGVCILAEDQAPISNLFARVGADKFSGIAVTDGIGGVPLIDGSAAQLECAAWKKYDGGDHLIIVGRVNAFRRWNRAPLIFSRGRYERLADEAPVLDEADWPISFF